VANTIEEQFQATGVAKVIAVVKDGQPAGGGAGLAAVVGGRSTVESVAAALASYFVVEHSQQAALAAAAVTGRKRAAPREVPRVRVYPALGLLLGTVQPEGLKQLRTDPRIQSVHSAPPLSLVRPVHTKKASKPSQVTWGLDRLRVPALWNHGLTGKGVLVGHLDTGVDGAHPALKGAIKHFAEFDLQGDQVPGAKPSDSDEHGTHTAGTILGRSVGKTAFGVAPGAQLASAMVIEHGDVIARVLAGMDWAVSLGVRILSMSLGLRGYTEDFLPLTRILRARNILPVFAAGNEGPGQTRSPGNYAEALSVGAVDSNDVVAGFSSSGHFNRPSDPIVPDLAAPGVDVVSSVPGNAYAQMSGTSMATPHVAGLAALLMEAKPEATADEVENAIFKSCALSTGMSPDRAGRGIPSGTAALQLLTGEVVPDPTTVVSPGTPARSRRPQRRAASRRRPTSRKSSTKRRSPPKRRSAKRKR
jgi:subtilisin family serine protease